MSHKSPMEWSLRNIKVSDRWREVPPRRGGGWLWAVFEDFIGLASMGPAGGGRDTRAVAGTRGSVGVGRAVRARPLNTGT